METTSRAHKAREAKLRADIEAYIASGGKINEIPYGVTKRNLAENQDKYLRHVSIVSGKKDER